jgi:hypothetical protein
MTLWFGGSALAGDYYVEWWHLQKRTYEDGSWHNRLGFGVTDASGTYVQSNVVQSVALEGPGGSIALPAHEFVPYENLYGEFIPDMLYWDYGPSFQVESYHRIQFGGGDLAAGNYTLTVVDTDGVQMPFRGSPTIAFNGVVELPEISSKSFHGYEDEAGNLLLFWDPPVDADYWNSPTDTSMRGFVSIYDGDAYVAEIFVKIPVVVGTMFVPSAVMNLARQKGDRFTFGLHIRTNDNNNRFYSNNLPLSSLKKQPGKVVVVPLGE